MSTNSPEQIRKRASEWLGSEFDEPTRKEVRHLLENDEKGLTDAFYKDLEFGTGGLRGIMGAGTNRMNIYTLGMAAQGQANYLLKQFGSGTDISVAIAHDCRRNSRFFAEAAAGIFAANGFTVYLFDSLRPTPLLSFVIREYGCRSGVVITASHNPPEYNGYKAYWDDGGQVVPPHDQEIINEVRNIRSVSQIKFGKDNTNIHILGSEADEKFVARLKSLSLNPGDIRSKADLPIVFTPIHGTTAILGPTALRAFGFTNVLNVPEQDIPDGNFSTVRSPNPEEPEALSMAIAKAEKTGAAVVMATDPDGDRLGIAVRDNSGRFALLNGNETGALLTWYIVSQFKENGLLKGNEYIIKTIVTSELMREIAVSHGVKCYDVLTGFKYFAELIRELEGKEKYIGGGEESYGYLPGDYVRDKDGIGSCALVAEAAAWAAVRGMSLYDLLIDIWIKHGFFRERLVNIVRKGKEGAEEIRRMMVGYRNNPPAEIAGRKVVRISDYETGVITDRISGKTEPTGLVKSDVLQFFLEDGSKISVRPSGTEPKIKFYFSVSGKINNRDQFESVRSELESRIDGIIAAMNLA
ncbi:MAG: phospho-sugar mutase [Bacteroidales bacterium]|jgi:phosphoglucomutase|nr:phospho-sugar mutase [Bacteroidales bacterium]